MTEHCSIFKKSIVFDNFDVKMVLFETLYLNCLIALLILGPMQLMYPYGSSAGDSEIPNTYEYSWQCFKVDIPDDGMQFFGKRHYKVHVRIYLLALDFN